VGTFHRLELLETFESAVIWRSILAAIEELQRGRLDGESVSWWPSSHTASAACCASVSRARRLLPPHPKGDSEAALGPLSVTAILLPRHPWMRW